jgi:hypothetical protein
VSPLARSPLRGLALLLWLLAPVLAGASEPAGPELHFLGAHPAGNVAAHSKTITITPASLDTGWVRNSQCLSRIRWWGDSVEIVFGPTTVRNIVLTRSRDIAKARVEGTTVQLEGIGDDAELCLTSENHILERDHGRSTWLLSVGPFMVKLFDGYFPMHVHLTIDYPAELLAVDRLEPAPGDGVTWREQPGRLGFSATFTGVLWVKPRFRRAAE